MVKPGPKPKQAKYKRSERIEVTLSPLEKKSLEKAAQAAGFPLAVFIRSKALGLI